MKLLQRSIILLIIILLNFPLLQIPVLVSAESEEDVTEDNVLDNAQSKQEEAVDVGIIEKTQKERRLERR